jgi:hypothetical protein
VQDLLIGKLKLSVTFPQKKLSVTNIFLYCFIPKHEVDSSFVDIEQLVKEAQIRVYPESR